MQSFYVPGRSWLHRLDPVTKMLMAGVTVVLLFVVPTVAGNTAIVAAAGLVLLSAGVARPAVRAFAGVLVAALSFLVVQSLVYPGNATPVLELGPVVVYREGLLVGLLLVLRLFGIVTGMLVLLLATRPTDLVESLVRRGLPPRAGYVIASVVQILPTVVERFRVVRDAQRARGLETEGSPWLRARAVLPLLGPVVTSALIATEERALALEVRGFSGHTRPTFLNEEQRPLYATAVRLACAAAVVGAVAVRLGR